MTKNELVAKLEALAEEWERGDKIDPYDAGPCTDTAQAYVSACADELLRALNDAEETD